jgi:hypothetical protein
MNLDSIEWAAGISFISYGVRVRIRVNDAAMLDQLPQLLPPGWKPVSSPLAKRVYSLVVAGYGAQKGARRGRMNILYADREMLLRSSNLDEMLERFESHLQLFVAEWARRRVFIHAGVVGWNGKAIVIPGRSFSGKTTLVAELVRAGADYYSDEYAVLDTRGRVHPYPKPLAIRENGSEEQTKYTAESFGGSIGARPLPVGIIVVSRYKTGARWRPRELSAGQSALELLSNAVPARTKPGEALAVLQKVVSNAPTVKGVRGDAGKAAASILRKLDEY